MTDQKDHPVPSFELLKKWRQFEPAELGVSAHWLHIATQAAAWGADQELEACCEWLRNDGLFETRIGHLRAARRPKPPSLKEQALAQLVALEQHGALAANTGTIRRALEALDD